MATIAVRLDPESEEALNRVARETGQTKSEIVREALLQLPKRKARRKVVRPYDLMKNGIGCFNSGGLRLSERTGDKFYELLVADRKRSEELNRDYYDALKKDLNKLDSNRRRSTRRAARR